MSTDTRAVIFSHGKESGPRGSKITAMAEVAERLGWRVDSIDYQGIDDPRARVEKLARSAWDWRGRAVLVGSSMGGHVSAAAAEKLEPLGLFLLAPAFYMPGLEQYTPRGLKCPTAIVHGWSDDIVPVENSVRWAREHRAALHVLDSDHRLQDQIPAINNLLESFLLSIPR